MKRLAILTAMALSTSYSIAQEDTLSKPKPDTIRIGNILIIKKDGRKNKGATTIDSTGTTVELGRQVSRKNSRVTTNWWILDLGFANYSDKTNYGASTPYLQNDPSPGVASIGASDLKLRTGKSINVNIWFFMQKLNLIKSNVSLKYGLGLELNNYRYKSGITYREGGQLPFSMTGAVTNTPFIYREDSVKFSKNKLAADYLTVPVMLNFATNSANNKKGLTMSVGVSAGYLYSQRNKQKSDAFGKEKNKGEYDLNRFKLSYIAELGLGPVRLYGSYSPKSMYEHSLDIRPYTFGFRFSNL